MSLLVVVKSSEAASSRAMAVAAARLHLGEVEGKAVAMVVLAVGLVVLAMV